MGFLPKKTTSGLFLQVYSQLAKNAGQTHEIVFNPQYNP